MKNLINQLSKDSKKFSLLILPLISASAVLRKENILKKLLFSANENKISFSKIYEALLQTYLFAGFPSALIALKIAFEVFHPDSIKIKTTSSVKKKGIRNCKKIYGDKFEKLISNISQFSPELSEWLITEGYGKVLSRRGLSLKERELSIVAVLCSLRFESQLYSHINGAVRLKNSFEDVNEVITALELIGEVKIKDFGLRVLNVYLKQK